jgi:hypothetical protein
LQIFCLQLLLPPEDDIDGEQPYGRRSGESILRMSGSGCSLASAGSRRECRVFPTVVTDTVVGGLSRTDLGAGEVAEGGEREDWADVERFEHEETGSAAFAI